MTVFGKRWSLMAFAGIWRDMKHRLGHRILWASSGDYGPAEGFDQSG